MTKTITKTDYESLKREYHKLRQRVHSGVLFEKQQYDDPYVCFVCGEPLLVIETIEPGICPECIGLRNYSESVLESEYNNKKQSHGGLYEKIKDPELKRILAPPPECRACGSTNLGEPYKVSRGSNLRGYICKDCNAITVVPMEKQEEP